MLGLELCERTISLDETGVERSRASQTLARLLRNHREAIAAMDLFTANDHLWRALLPLRSCNSCGKRFPLS